MSAVLLGVVGHGSRAATPDPCAPPASAVACENSKPGTPAAVWDLATPAGDTSIQGFTTDISVNRGATVDFKVNAPVGVTYRIDVYRLGYYQGNGARFVGTVGPLSGAAQPACLTDSTGLVDCGNWNLSASWSVPADAVSGVYVAKLVRGDTGGANHVVFVVRDDAGASDLLFQTSDTTWQAYNRYGGNSLYVGTHTAVGNPAGRAYKVSYNRPFSTRANEPTSWVFGPEFAMIRYLERNGYDVGYTSGVDTARRGSLIRNHKVFMSVGHDEYWSGQQRASVEAARDSGVNLAFFSGNEIFWKTRWEPSIAPAATSYRTLVCYKETAANAKIDPDPSWTGWWRDKRFSPPADGGRPENALSGTLSEVEFSSQAIHVHADEGKLRFWRSTSFAGLAPGQEDVLPTGVLGYEWDEARDNGFRPSGLFTLSSSTYSVGNIEDTGQAGNVTHSLTLYRAPSRALVFGAGTIQWSYGLDGGHDATTSVAVPTDTRMQQATANLLADMGAQPATLAPDLTPATATTDTTAPTSSVTAPAAGTALTAGTPVTVTGTAADTGGRIGGVDVSVDGGRTWHPATGRESWSYTFTPAASGSLTVASRAVDDSGNIQPVSAAGACPCSIWGDAAVPAVASASDAASYELGVKFRSDADGFVSGIRFYKGAANTGTHMGHLWKPDGTLLASATFVSESGSGWQQVSFAQPVAVSANTTYVASYYAPNGGFALDRPGFSPLGVDNPPLHALADQAGEPNGVYLQGSSGFPTQSFGASNYWVDVVFATTATDTTAPTVSSVSPVAGAGGVAAGTTVSARFSEALDASSVTTTSFQLLDAASRAVAGTVAYDATNGAATLTPTAPLALGTTYTAVLSGVRDRAGNALAADYRWSFSTGAARTCPCSIWSDAAVPAVASASDAGTYELGVKFRSDVDGSVSGIRFYKGPANTGTHVGHLWRADGTLLGTATFVAESGSGWQQVSFAQPVAISANTTYVASYFAPNGGYALDRPGFSPLGVDNPPLHALADQAGDPNGVYLQGGSGFPMQSFGAGNYWVDVVFASAQPPADTTPPDTQITSGPPSSTTSTSATFTFTSTETPSSFRCRLDGAAFSACTSPVTYAGLAAGSHAFDAAAVDAAGNVDPTPASSTWTVADSTVRINAGGASYTTAAGATFAADGSFTGGTSASTTDAIAGTSDPALYKDERWGNFAYAIPIANGSYDVRFHFVELGYVGVPCTGLRVFGMDVLDTPASPDIKNLDICSLVGADAALVRTVTGVTVGDGVLDVKGVYGSADDPELAAIEILPAAPTAPPTVASTSPAAGATAFAVGSPLQATFSRDLNPTTITGSTFTLATTNGAAVAATVSYDAATRIATLTPSAPLAYATQYRARLEAAIGAADGTLLGNTVAWTFKTGAAPVATPTTVRINTGGAAYTSVAGSPFAADNYFTGGTVATTTDAIAGTADPALYQNERWGSFAYAVPVTNGSYDVRLHFVEIGYVGVPCTGLRVFGMDILDTPTSPDVKDLDICALVGSDAALVRTVTGVAVADGFLNVQAVYGSADDPQLAAIEVLPAAPTAPPTASTTPLAGATGVNVTAPLRVVFSRDMDATTITGSNFSLRTNAGATVAAKASYDPTTRTGTLTPTAPLANGTKYRARVEATAAAADGTLFGNTLAWTFTTQSATTRRVNVGGGAYTTAAGTTFAADNYFTGGNVATTTATITGTNDPALYQNERWGSFSYAIPVNNGSYDVRLHFVEIGYGQPCTGARVFGMDVLDTVASPDVKNLDICALVGANAALVKTVSGVAVADGALNLQGVYGSADDPELAAVEVIPAR